MNTDPQHILEEAQSASSPTFFSRDEVIQDYRHAYRSRQVSLIGRREVLTGKAKFGIFGDGKEVAQLAMAKAFQEGDFRSGYYRDQTFGLTTGMVSVRQYFAQLFADPSLERDPHSAGRQMNCHLATRLIDEEGRWLPQTDRYLTTADLSPTAGQMPRLVGLAQASSLYRHLPELQQFTDFSQQGNEIAFGTIGNASCAEGHFWETVNAVGVLQAPMLLAIWDDEYGISVPNKFQITKSNLSEVLKGFQRDEDATGYEIYTVKGWDYPALCRVFLEAAELTRREHVPTLIHVTEVTQPQGHSTSGSHERYKSQERLEWERAHDCLVKMRAWMIAEGFASEEELLDWEKEDRKYVRREKNEAWKAFQAPIKQEITGLVSILNEMIPLSRYKEDLSTVIAKLRQKTEVNRRDYMEASHRALLITHQELNPIRKKLVEWRAKRQEEAIVNYDSHLFTDTIFSPLKVEEIKPTYAEDAPLMSGFQLLNRCFDGMLSRDPRVVAFGEDVGFLGDVNQGFAGLQKIHGPLRVMDTGIREATIMGQAIGLALRGLRPIAEIQYLDYLLYGLQPLADDLASLSYRTRAGQKAPVIIRTRGHRLEGIWHAGSPMGMILNALRGIHVLVPRNMTQAAGFYNTLLKSDEPALVIEVLNGYRLKERLPKNLHEFCVPLGEPEVIRPGTDLTIVTYGACCRIAMTAAQQLAEIDIEAEVIDVQSLLPFDRNHRIVESLKKTNRVLFLDEDVPGGATAYMMQQVLEQQDGYFFLDSQPRTVTAKAHRTAYGSDGDYWSKPQVEHVFHTAYEMMHEMDPEAFPVFG